MSRQPEEGTEDDMTAVAPEDKPLTLREWVSAAGFVLAIYALVGLFWADSHSAQFEAFGIEKPITYAAHVLAWPVLVFTDLDIFGLHLT